MLGAGPEFVTTSVPGARCGALAVLSLSGAPPGRHPVAQEPRDDRPTDRHRPRLDDRPLGRDAYAAALAEQADPTGADGDRVRLTYGDGSTVGGRWAFVGGDIEGFVLLADDGSVHDGTGPVRRGVIERAERPLLALLSQVESLVAAGLLDELAGVYAGEELGRLARAMAVRLYDRLGV
jgi:hypothetical protein